MKYDEDTLEILRAIGVVIHHTVSLHILKAGYQVCVHDQADGTATRMIGHGVTAIEAAMNARTTVCKGIVYGKKRKS